MKTLVLKFGGTSVGSIDRIKKVCKNFVPKVHNLISSQLLAIEILINVRIF